MHVRILYTKEKITNHQFQDMIDKAIDERRFIDEISLIGCDVTDVDFSCLQNARLIKLKKLNLSHSRLSTKQAVDVIESARKADFTHLNLDDCINVSEYYKKQVKLSLDSQLERKPQGFFSLFNHKKASRLVPHDEMNSEMENIWYALSNLLLHNQIVSLNLSHHFMESRGGMYAIFPLNQLRLGLRQNTSLKELILRHNFLHDRENINILVNAFLENEKLSLETLDISFGDNQNRWFTPGILYAYLQAEHCRLKTLIMDQEYPIDVTKLLRAVERNPESQLTHISAYFQKNTHAFGDKVTIDNMKCLEALQIIRPSLTSGFGLLPLEVKPEIESEVAHGTSSLRLLQM